MSAPVHRFHGDDAGAVEDVGVARINFDNGQIAAADTQGRPRIDSGAKPRLTRIIGSVHTEAGARAVIPFCGRRESRGPPPGPARRTRHFDLRQILRKPARQLAPMIAPVTGLVESAAGTVEDVVVLPRAGAHIPKPRVQNVGSARVDFDARAARVVTDVKHSGPSLSAIYGPVNSTLRTWTVRMTQHRGVQPVGISRIHGEIGDLLRVVKG